VAAVSGLLAWGKDGTRQGGGVVRHDDVVLSVQERAALCELVAAMPAEDRWLAALLGDGGVFQTTTATPQVATAAGRRRHLLLVAVLVTSAVLALALAILATGDLAWSAWLILAWGTLAGVCLTTGGRSQPRPLPTTMPGWAPTAGRPADSRQRRLPSS
jgi:hypothetical protein